jgi:hypothetical protein
MQIDLTGHSALITGGSTCGAAISVRTRDNQGEKVF